MRLNGAPGEGLWGSEMGSTRHDIQIVYLSLLPSSNQYHKALGQGLCRTGLH